MLLGSVMPDSAWPCSAGGWRACGWGDGPLACPRWARTSTAATLHKWGATAKGCALLWVAPSEQQDVLPPVTSHGYGLVRSPHRIPWTLQPAAIAAETTSEELSDMQRTGMRSHRPQT